MINRHTVTRLFVLRRPWHALLAMAVFAAASTSLGGPSVRADERERLRGTQFVNLARGNTFYGTRDNGVRFKVFFLSGFKATYIDETGRRDTGDWRLREDDAICVRWFNLAAGKEVCNVLFRDGKRIILSGDGPLREIQFLGTVDASFD